MLLQAFTLGDLPANIFLTLLAASALILSVVNGLILVWQFLRDRPKVSVEPIHPKVYQWYFKLPPGEYDGYQTRKFGFLAYLAIANRGLRDVAVNFWHLYIKTKNAGLQELLPYSIPEPRVELGESGMGKVYRVLGASGVFFRQDMMIKSGASVGGFAYYVAEFYGSDEYNPLIVDGEAKAKILIKTVFGNKATTNISFREISLDDATKMVPGIDTIDSPGGGSG
jgi:hypothetical protein